jgi:hypothetical protein
MIGALSPLEVWANFYVIIGSSAAALTGLQFVVIALIADSPRKTSAPEIGTFGTPNVIHFCAVLLFSAILSAPWPEIAYAATALILTGSAGFGYGAVVLRRALQSKGYKPVWEDWLWYTALPMTGYATVVAGAATLVSRTTGGLFAIAAGSLILLFDGIHNSWDTVTFIVVRRSEEGASAPDSQA